MEQQGNLVPGSWKYPERKSFEGKYCRVEPLAMKHCDELYEVSTVPDAFTRYRYLLNYPPVTKMDKPSFEKWLANLVSQKDPIAFAVIDKSTGRVEGKQHLMRIESHYGVIEIGSIIYGPKIARSRVATEAFYLMACYVFDELKYRRYEWKCNNANAGSKNAALRFGYQFEGIFRQHLIDDFGQNRDSAWFSMLDGEWPAIKASYEKWLDESNFDELGHQKKSLASFRV